MGIKHIKTSPFHPQSNGLAERFVDTFKRTYKKLRTIHDPQTAMNMFLQYYRSSPDSTGQAPAEKFLGRKIRTSLDMLTFNDELCRTRIETQAASASKAKGNFDRRHGVREKKFHKGETVWTRDFRQQTHKWTKGKILRRIGNVLYEVQVGDVRWRRHANQLKKFHKPAFIHILNQPTQELRRTRGRPDETAGPPIPARMPRTQRTRNPPSRLQVTKGGKSYAESRERHVP